jgi:putative colanic acid biosynthesis acetyltransferase WcaF
MNVDLSLTTNRDYIPGRPFMARALWVIVEALVLLNPVVTSYRFKRAVLRLFGARIGGDVIVKPGVHVKYPWRLRVGDNCWLGERCWIDNMEDVSIGRNVVISQGAYLCTGNHDWADPGMGLTPQPIVIDEGAWIGAFARVAPGTHVAQEGVLVLGAVLLTDSEPRGIYAGNPAALVRWRTVRDAPGPAVEFGQQVASNRDVPALR